MSILTRKALGTDAGATHCEGQGNRFPYVRNGDGDSTLAANPSLEGIRAQLECVAGVDLPVLVLGEKGAGKGEFARLIHQLSSRSHHVLRSLNCAALSADLLEGELFGTGHGDATGAGSPRRGIVELANKGTLLLEEISAIPHSVQGKLLRALQTRQLSRQEGAPLRLDVRVLATMSVNQEGVPDNGSLREDLLGRLSVLTIVLPSLRNRQKQMSHLLKHFIEDTARRLGIAAKTLYKHVLNIFLNCDLRGSLRELKAFAMRCLAHDGEEDVLRELSHKRRCDARGMKDMAWPALLSAPPSTRQERTSFWLDRAPAAPPMPWESQGIPMAAALGSPAPKCAAKVHAGRRLMTFPEQFRDRAGIARRRELLKPHHRSNPEPPRSNTSLL